MAKSNNKVVPKKRRGRPATGRDAVTAIRLSKELRETIDKWAAQQEYPPGRSEAIRRLIELGLKVKTPMASPGKAGRRLRAQELATKTIEKILEADVPPEERAQRRRRLTKGPPEFREDRVDLPKRKS